MGFPMYLYSFVLLVLFGTVAVYATTICITDADCSNGQGVCLSSSGGNYCSCKSGFGGYDCSIAPSSSCSADYAEVNSTGVQFSAEASLKYLFPNLTIQVEANLQETSWADPWNMPNAVANQEPYSLGTTFVFGDGSFPECNFPGPLWEQSNAQSGNCVDSFSSSISWGDAKSKCGFQDSIGNRTFTQKVTVSRKYKLPTVRGTELYRTESTTRELRVLFPTEISTSTSKIQITGAPGVLAAITKIDYDPAATPEKWTVTLFSSVQAPFKLSNPQVVSSSGQILSQNRFMIGSEYLVDNAPCNNNSVNCAQTSTFTFVKGGAQDACLALIGSVVVQYNLECSQGLGAECPLVGNETAQLTLLLSTGNACPVTEEIVFTTTTLTSYANAALSVPRRSFLTSDTLYFGAVVEAAQANIATRAVKPGSVCAQLTSGGACHLLNYTVVADVNGKAPVFEVPLTEASNAAIFAALDGAEASAADYIVKATVQVWFTDMKKRAVTDNNGRSIDLIASMTVSGSQVESEDASGASSLLPHAFLLATLLGIFA